MRNGYVMLVAVAAATADGVRTRGICDFCVDVIIAMVINRLLVTCHCARN